MKDEIEQLQVSQIEKQLHLKEMATRKKMQELKQQLQNVSNVATATHSPVSRPDHVLGQSPSHSTTESHTRSRDTPYSHSVIQPYTHSKSPGSGTNHSTPSPTVSHAQKLDKKESKQNFMKDFDTTNVKSLQPTPTVRPVYNIMHKQITYIIIIHSNYYNMYIHV